jgi:hypothetical protein
MQERGRSGTSTLGFHGSLLEPSIREALGLTVQPGLLVAADKVIDSEVLCCTAGVRP